MRVDLVAHRFEEGTQAEVAGAAQEAFAGTNDEGQRVGARSVELKKSIETKVKRFFTVLGNLSRESTKT